MCGALDCGRCGVSDEELRDYMEDEDEPTTDSRAPNFESEIGDPNIPDRLDKFRGEYLNEPPF